MITYVRLKNWKSHRETELRFGDGTNVLVGIMGAGKSAVLDAITYALFGTLPYVKSRRIKLEDLIMSRPRPMERAEVEVGFLTPDENEYSVKRAIERGKGTVLSELRKESGELVESGSSDRVTENIRDLLGLDYDLYERAVYSEQNKLDYFLSLPKGERMRNMDKLLGMDKLELARKGLGTLANRASDRAKDLTSRVEQLKLDPSLPRLSDYEKELKSLEDSRGTMEEELRRLKPELEESERLAQKYREIEKKISELESRYSGLASAAKEIENQITQLRGRLGPDAEVSAEERQSKVKQLEQEYQARLSVQRKAESDYANASLALGSSETQLSMLKQSSQKLLADVESKRMSKEELEKMNAGEIGARVESLHAEIRGLEGEQGALNARTEDLKQSIQELSEAEAQCPVCESPLDQPKKQGLLEKKRAQLGELGGRVDDVGTRLKALKEELNGKLGLQRKALLLNRDAEELPAKEAEHLKLLNQAKIIEKGLPGLRTASEQLGKEAERCKMESENVRGALTQAQQKLELRLDLDRQELNRKQKIDEGLRVKVELEQAQAAYDPAEVKKAGERRDELLQRCSRLDAQVRGVSQLVVEKGNFVKSLQDKLAEVRRGELKAKHLKEVVQALATIQTAVSRTQTSMRQMFMDGVNEVLGDFWDDIYPYGDYIGVKLSVEGDEKGGDYVLQLRDRGGNWVPVDGMASGGERTDACLALRIAFSIVLAPDLRWIVFDEPTHNLDTEGIQELAKAMRERLPQIVRQILLITHEERLEGAVSGYLYRFYRDKANDEPTKIEKVSVPELLE